jgi:glycosyltransferase involved in cell wall biosynthesis
LSEATPEVTIVVTTCDRPHLAEKAVASALAQTEPRLEVIVVDDGTGEPFDPPNPDPRLRVIRTTGRIGPSGARNRGLGLARGTWITFLDDDDELLPEMVAISLRAAQTSSLPSPLGVVSGFEVVDLAGRIVETLLPESLSVGSGDLGEIRRMARHANVVLPTGVLREMGGFDEEIRASEHTDLYLRLARVVSLEGVRLVTYRALEHPGTRVSKSNLLRALGMARTHAKHRHVFRSDPRQEADYLGRAGMRFLSAGRWGGALHLTLRALVRDPRRPGAVQQAILALAGPRLATPYIRVSDRTEKTQAGSG